MGLDMYIHRKVHGYRKSDGTLSQSLEDYVSDEFGCANSEVIETQVAYWRKANAIHNWFVEHVQSGEDDCKEYEIEIETIKELRDVCYNILKQMKGMVLRVPKKSLEDFKKLYGDKGIKQRITIDPDNLSELSNVTDYHVVSDPSICEEELPTTDGFFFGSTSYDGGYFWEIAKTIRMFDRIIEQHEKDEKNGVYPYYTYQASW